MLKLRQLEIQGFKSFVDKTRIEIRDDLLIVVGPNGSGKSNIADCILWAIGEQSAKSLRGAKMQDVIFHGTKKRPAAGSAEVFMLFEKEDGQKVRVGRRLNRNGDSSYLIDDNQVRLKDIHEFCYRNNISVQGSYLVEQGRVEKMLALSPQDRKSLFEEVAGIAHYKESRKNSESKLQATQNNLLRVNDIIVEVEAEQAELKKQALRAERYMKIQDELNAKRRTFFGRNLQELMARKKLLDGELALYYDEREKRSADLATLESGLEASKLRKTDEESAFDSLTGAIHQLELSKQKKEQENSRRVDQITNAKSRIRQIDEDQVTLAQREKERRKELAGLDTRKAESARQKEEINGKLEKASKLLDELKKKLETAVNEIETKRKASFELAQERSSRSSTFNQIGEELKKLSERESRQKKELETLASQREKAEESLGNEEASLLEKTNRLAEKVAELAKVRGMIESVQKDISSMTREISVCDMSIASCATKIKVLQDQEKQQKSKARDILEKKDGSLEEKKLASLLAGVPRKTLKALELIIGEGLLGYRLDDSKKALALIDSVKDELKERVAFLASDLGGGRDSGGEESKNFKSFLGYVDEMEGFPSWLKGHVRKTARFSDRDDALSFVRKSGLPAIVDDSVIINPRGLIFGGPSKELALPLLKISKELEETGKQLKSEQAKISELKDKLSALKKKEGEALVAETSAVSERDKMQAAVQKAGLSKQNAESELKRITSLENLTRDEEASIREQREEYESERKNLEGRLKHLEKEIAETNGSLSMLTADEARFRQDLSKADEALTQKRIEESQWDERNKALESQLNNLNTALEEVVSARARLDSEKELLVSKIRKLETDMLDEEKRLSEVLTEMTASREKLQNYSDIIKSLEDELQRSEKLVKEARETSNEVQIAISEREKELAEVNSDHKNIIERFSSYFEEEWEALASEWEGAPRMTPEEKETGYSHVSRLEKRLNEMGQQNLLAKEEYDKKSKRADFLKEQKKDVENAIAQLEETIRKANETIKARYIEAYEEVNKNFTELFKVVFEGGEAYLKLEDPENPLESGIEIFAQPFGKKVLHNIQLSGGESALVALTLLFAILSYRPQPFFLLDEVDAPLDDANIERVLSKLLLQFSQKTQFIVISHNKRTMALGDAIYGVTMEELGISKVISVSLKEVSA